MQYNFRSMAVTMMRESKSGNTIQYESKKIISRHGRETNSRCIMWLELHSIYLFTSSQTSTRTKMNMNIPRHTHTISFFQYSEISCFGCSLASVELDFQWLWDTRRIEICIRYTTFRFSLNQTNRGFGQITYHSASFIRRPRSFLIYAFLIFEYLLYAEAVITTHKR